MATTTDAAAKPKAPDTDKTGDLAALKTRQHARLGTGRDDRILGLDFRGLTIGCDFDGQYPILRRTGQLAVTFHRLHLVLAHEELETFSVLGHDLRLAFLDGRPIQVARVDAFDAEFTGVFQVVPKLGIEQ